MLTFNGVDQYIVFNPDYIVRPGSTCTVTVNNTSDSAKIFDTNNGDVNVVSNTVILSNIDGPVIEIGRNLTAGTFYSGIISDIAFKNTDQGRFFSLLSDFVNTPFSHPATESDALIEFDITMGADAIPTAEEMFVLTSTTTFGFKFINGIFTYSEEFEPVGPIQIPLAANAQYHVKLETSVNLVTVEINSKVVINQVMANYAGTNISFLGDSFNLVDFDVCVSSLHMDYTASATPHDFIYLIDETSGLSMACSDPTFDTAWDTIEPNRKTLPLINSTYDLGEGSGSAVSDNEGNSTGIIQSFDESMWSGGSGPAAELVQKIRQSIFVLES